MLYIIANGDIIGRPRFRAIYFFIAHGVEIELFVVPRNFAYRVHLLDHVILRRMQIGIDRVPFSQRLRDYCRRPWKIQVGGKYRNRAIDFDRSQRFQI